jgi:hypothetical protein
MKSIRGRQEEHKPDEEIFHDRQENISKPSLLISKSPLPLLEVRTLLQTVCWLHWTSVKIL